MNRLEELEKMGWGVEEIAELLEQIKEKMERNESREDSSISLNKKLFKLANEIGMPINLDGRKYVIEAVKYCMKKDGKIYLKRDVYPYLADKYGVNAMSIERAIRHTIDKTICHMNPKLEEIFGKMIWKDNVSVTNFIYGIVSYLKLETN